MGTCMKCNHTKDGCDESCNCCGQCYMKYRLEICNKICEHAEHEDDGGFFIDGNHPDDMYGLGEDK